MHPTPFMDEPVYRGIGKLVERGASLEEVERYIATRNQAADEEERSAAWLRDWLAFERLERGLIPVPRGPDPL